MRSNRTFSFFHVVDAVHQSSEVAITGNFHKAGTDGTLHEN